MLSSEHNVPGCCDFYGYEGAMVLRDDQGNTYNKAFATVTIDISLTAHKRCRLVCWLWHCRPC